MKLKNLPVFFLDLQTTGSKPDNAHILEMAFSYPDGETQSFLVEQPIGKDIPRRIQLITGIKDSDMDQSVAFPEAMKRLIKFSKAYCVIHFSQFEKPFLQSAFEAIKKEMPFTIICTHDISKRLLPNLPTRGIKGLAGYFGYDAGELKRAASHVEATKAIWKELMKTFEVEKEIHTIDELNTWLIETPKGKRTKYEYPLPKEKRLNLPNVPGIYRMLNFKNEVLYVGKATSLKSRVNSYFRGQKNRDPKKLEMLTQVMDLDVTPCATPLEAALMETDEIKRLNPRYNISLKVGRRKLVFFDREFTSSSSILDEIHYIGPFSNALVFESMISLSTYLGTTYDQGGLPDANTFFEELDPEFIKEGLEIFCIRHNFIPQMLASMRSILAIGIIWQRKLRKLKLEADLLADNIKDEIEEVEESILEENLEDIQDEVMTTEDLADKLERHFQRIGLAYLRARKINRLLNADVEYQIPKQKIRKIEIRDGNILGPTTTCAAKNTWQDHSIETYDRMTVLLTELERIKTNQGHYTIEFLN
jgi:DNA polymerase-3 subunit epsilon